MRVWLNSVNHKTVFFISTHTPVRVWRFLRSITPGSLQFQLTHPWGCDAAVNRNIPYSGIFQLTHSWGCDCTSPEPDINRNNHFNSHTREGVTYYLAYSRLPIKGFQLTHPWGCDGRWTYKEEKTGISTHTPVRVWPLWKLFQLVGGFISTHTPVRVWQTSGLKLPAEVNFNSHTREGVTALRHFPSAPPHFNSHTREGVTPSWWTFPLSLRYFNSHTREGVTALRHFPSAPPHFNSHTREGVTNRLY